MVDFSGFQGTGGSSDLIPDGQLAWVVIAFRGTKLSQKTGGRYLDLEVTLDDGQPFAHRKLWPMVMDPTDPKNSEKARAMGGAALSRILEVGQNASPANPAGYALGGGQEAPACYAALHGLKAAVKIKVRPAEGAYAEKNEVADWLSPNPGGATFKTYQRLVTGDVAGKAPAPAAAAPTGSFFGAPAAPAAAPLAAPGFLMAAQPVAAAPAAVASPAAAPAPGGWGAPAAAVATPGFLPSAAPAASAQPVSAPAPAAPLAAAPSNGGWAAQVAPTA